MTVVGKLNCPKENPRAHKIFIAAEYNGVQLEVPAMTMADAKSPAYLEKFPLGKVPTFEGKDGLHLFESSAIAHHIATLGNGKLIPSCKKQQAEIIQYLSFCDAEVSPLTARWLYVLLGYAQGTKQTFDHAVQFFHEFSAKLDHMLVAKTYLVGNKVTLADVLFTCSISFAYQMLYTEQCRKKYVNLTRYFTTLVNQPEFKKVMGEFKYCQHAPAFDEKAYEKKQAEIKAFLSKPAAAAPAAEQESGEKTEKVKNPLDLLPPSPFVMDAWKRFYSNNDVRPDSIRYFWDNYDPQGYSIWKVDYKYNSELTLTFMSSNLIGGFFQRIERARKYAFGSMLVLGENNNNEISGYFLFRGLEVPFEITDAPDYESFKFTRADINDPAVRESFEDYLAWDGKLDGKKFCDGKIFK